MKGDFTFHSRLVPFGCRIGLLLASISLCGYAATAQSVHQTQASAHMPQGAFLRQPSPNVAALVRQVKSDPKVAVRYARLFHLPVKMVPAALEQLHVKNLSADHVLQVHYVAADKSHGDKLVYKPRRVKKGTPVYCLPDGTPLLIRVCGNPIRSRVSPELYTATPVPDFAPGEALIPPTASSSVAMGGPSGRVIVPPTTMLPVIPVVLAENVLGPTELPIAAPTLTPPQLRTASLPPVYHWVHGGPGLVGLAGPLALLPLLGMGGHSGHSASLPAVPITGVSTIIPTTGTTGESPVLTESPLPVTTPNVPVGSLPGQTPELPVGSTPIITPETPGGSPGVPGSPIITPLGPGFQVTPEPGSITLAITLLMGAGWVAGRKRRK